MKDIILSLTMVDSNVFDVASVIIPQAVFTHILKQIIDRELYMSTTHWQSSGKSKMRIVITAKKSFSNHRKVRGHYILRPFKQRFIAVVRLNREYYFNLCLNLFTQRKILDLPPWLPSDQSNLAFWLNTLIVLSLIVKMIFQKKISNI